MFIVTICHLSTLSQPLMQDCINTLQCISLDETAGHVHFHTMANLIDLTQSTRKHRHPEKQSRPDTPLLRKPDWIRVKAPTSQGYAETRQIVKSKGLVTVCEEAGCPNIGECWDKKHATMMILGEICTRACSFCNVSTGKPLTPGRVEEDEPRRVAEAVAEIRAVAYSRMRAPSCPESRISLARA